jgi:RNA polymerase-binding transcription factor
LSALHRASLNKEKATQMANVSNAAGLDPKQLDTLKGKLIALRAALGSRHSGDLASRASGAADVEDEGDTAQRTNDEETQRALAEADHTRLAEIEHALLKFDDGTYGLDEDTEEPIGFARLAVLPWARFSATTQERLEKLEKRG